MVEGSLSKRSLKLPTNNFPRSLSLSLHGGTVGSIVLSSSRRRRSSNASSSRCRRSIVSLPCTRCHICAFVFDTGARNSRNHIRMSSTGEQLSKYLADDPRSARAFSKLGVVGPELHDNSSGNPSTPFATSLASALRAPSFVVLALASTHRELFHNVQRHTASTFRHFAAKWSCLEPVALIDQLSHAEDRRYP